MNAASFNVLALVLLAVSAHFAPADEPKKGEPNKEPDSGAVDRKAAEYVLSVGGRVHINDVGEVKELPKEPFVLKLASMAYKEDVKEADLIVFRECKNLVSLDLAGTKTSNAALTNFANSKQLQRLDLSSTKVTDDGLAVFKELTTLTRLELAFMSVGDAGLAHFQNCKDLKFLDLRSSGVSDTGFDQIKRFTKLTHLDVRETKVTTKGVAELVKALPDCRIEWDGGTVEPKKK